jgi:hypothetical protein
LQTVAFRDMFPKGSVRSFRERTVIFIVCTTLESIVKDGTYTSYAYIHAEQTRRWSRCARAFLSGQ